MDDIKNCFTEIGCEYVNWIQLAHYRIQRYAFVNTVMNLGVLKQMCWSTEVVV
jgi:hypothetical protein